MTVNLVHRVAVATPVVAAILVWASCSLGCRDRQPQPVERVTIPLPELWSGMRGALLDRRDGIPALSTSTVVHLTGEQAVPGAELHLEGAWYTVTVTVNGHELPVATGGFAPVDVWLGPWLRPGDNELVLRVEPPAASTPSLPSGEMRAYGALAAMPELRVHAEQFVRAATLVDDGERVAGFARVTAPDGWIARFSVHHDGGVLDLGAAAVHGEDARTEPVSWSLPRWAPGRGGGFVDLRVDLSSPAGTVIDQFSTRSAARPLRSTGGPLQVAGVDWPLLGLRWGGGPATAEVLSIAALSLSAVEIHGQAFTTALFDAADEAGLGVVMLRRCEGRLRTGGRTGKPVGAIDRAERARLSSLLAEQDRRAVELTFSHPSAVLWSEEGNYADGGPLDPLRRPAVGKDVHGLGPVRESGVVRGGWKVEFNHEEAMSASELYNYVAQGAVGGILPDPRSAPLPRR